MCLWFTLLYRFYHLLFCQDDLNLHWLRVHFRMRHCAIGTHFSQIAPINYVLVANGSLNLDKGIFMPHGPCPSHHGPTFLPVMCRLAPNIFEWTLHCFQIVTLGHLWGSNILKRDVICEKVPYCGTNSVGPDKTPRIKCGVWSGLRYLSLMSI